VHPFSTPPFKNVSIKTETTKIKFHLSKKKDEILFQDFQFFFILFKNNNKKASNYEFEAYTGDPLKEYI